MIESIKYKLNGIWYNAMPPKYIVPDCEVIHIIEIINGKKIREIMSKKRLKKFDHLTATHK